MNKKWLAVLAAMVAVACMGCNGEYLVVRNTVKGTAVMKYRRGIPANLVIPDGIQTIALGAFRGCKSLESVTFPDSVTEIGSNAFEGCVSLTSVTIPESVTTIGGGAFEGCTSLKEIQFGGTMAQWKAIEGSNSIKILGTACSDGYLGIKDAPEYLKIARTGNRVEITGYTSEVPADLAIPAGVTVIGENAFRVCESLASVIIPDGVTVIGKDAFWHCESLVNVTLPKSVREIGEYAFEYCESLASVSIPDGVTKIGLGTFEGCKSLADVTIPTSVEKIATNAFSGCTSLERVNIPGNTLIYRFLGRESPKELHFGGTTAQFLKIWENMDRESLSDTTVFYCTDGHFTVRSMPLPNHSQYLELSGTKVVDYKSSLPKNLVIPKGITEIGRRAFKESSIRSVTLSNTVREIGSSAFYNCESLTSVTIPNGVTKIGDWAFQNCKWLKSVNLPDSVGWIGTAAFWGCDSLASVTLPKNVRYIAYDAFPDKTALRYPGTKAQWRALDTLSTRTVQCSDGEVRGK